MKSVRRHLLSVVVGALVVALLVYAFWPQPVEADVATAKRGPLVVTVDEDGKTRIKDRYIVSAPLAGRLARVTLRPGDKVVAGRSVVASIEPTDPALLDDRALAEAEARVKALETAVKQAGPKLDRARTAHEQAKADLARMRGLFEKRAISQQELADAIYKELLMHEEAKTAVFASQIANFDLDLARAALVRTRPRSPGEAEAWRFDIPAPVDGQVLRVFQESSAVVTPGLKLLEVGNPTDLEIEVDVLSSDAVKIAPGAKVIVEQWGGDKPLEGRVRLVEPAGFLKISALGVEEQRVNVIIDFADPPARRARLGDGYRVEARVVIWEADDVLKAPAGALFRRGEDWAVYAVVDELAELRTVKTGRSNGLETEILEGLSAGDTVVLHPGDKIQAGVKIKAR